MPPPSRFANVLLNRRIPVRTRLGLLTAESRRRLRPEAAYAIPYGGGTLYLSHDDYEIDWETLKSVLVDQPYPADYRGAVALDVGAHKGYFGAWALAHGAGTVVSFKPEAGNLAFLERSADSFTAGNRTWKVERVAVGVEAGEAELHVMGASWGHSLHPPDEFSEYEIGVQRVPLVAMADVLESARSLSGSRSRIIVKVNTEGEECETVLGTPPEAWAGVSEVLVETHPWASCGADEMAEHLERAGLTRIRSAHPRMLQLRR